MVLVEPGNNLAVQFGRGFNCELQLLLRYVARRIVAGYVPLFEKVLIFWIIIGQRMSLCSHNESNCTHFESEPRRKSVPMA